MKLTKILCLDENYLFPNCKKCGQELSPFCVTSEELNTINVVYLKLLLESKLLIMNGLREDKHILFVCKTCSDLTKEIL